MSDYNGSNTPIDIRDLWQTPPEIYAGLDREFGFTGDVAASDKNHLHPRYLTEADDALSCDWSDAFHAGYVWCNPPYSDITPWVAQAAKSSADGGVGAVMLVPADMSVGWFRLALETVSEVRIITGGRISFVRADNLQAVNGNNKGSMLLIWNPMRRGACLTSYVDRNELIEAGRKILQSEAA